MRDFLVLSSLVVSLGLGGCGGCNDTNGVGHLPDASPALDAELDAPTDVATVDSVTITVTLGGSPKMGLTVFFQESDSALVRTMPTGADGKASAVLHAGGFVTVVRRTVPDAPSEAPPGPSSQLFTFAGVKPGDDLHLDLEPAAPELTEVTFDLSVPNEELGNTYKLYSSCGGPVTIGVGQSPVRAGQGLARPGSAAATPVTGSVTLAGCGGTADMLVGSHDAEGGFLASWQYQPAVTVANGLPVALTDAYQETTDIHFTYTSVASTLHNVSFVRELWSGRGRLISTGLQATTLVDDTASATMLAPKPAGLLQVVTTQDDPGAGHGRQSFIEWGGDEDYTLDYGGGVLHGYASRPSAEVGSHMIQWSEAEGGVAPDFVLGRYELTRFDDSGSNFWSWQIVAPYAAGQPKLTYPVLPTTIYDYNPAADEQVDVQRLTTVKVPGGYDAFRAHAFTAIRESLFDGQPQFGITGAAGRIAIEEMFEPRVVDPGAAAPRRSMSGRPVPHKR
jgi:hypothetical protein